MDKEGVLAALAILVLSGVLVYAYKSARVVNALQANVAGYAQIADNANDVMTSEVLAAGLAGLDGFNTGPQIYIAQTPYLFNVGVGNVIPSTSPTNTLWGAVQPAQSSIVTHT